MIIYRKHKTSGILLVGILATLLTDATVSAATSQTEVSIRGDSFYLNGQPTYAGRTWNGNKIEGLLLNSRMVQGIFDDKNPQTVGKWAYPDTHKWDPERNTNEFIADMPEWRRHGLLAITINLQGGSPFGYSGVQPWENTAYGRDGSLLPDYTSRLERILNRADELGMVVIVGYFYFGQDNRLRDDAAVANATDNVTKWILDHGWRNVLVEINNECNGGYHHAILKPDRVSELIDRVKATQRNGRRLLVGTSYTGGQIPGEAVVRESDFLLMHGNSISKPEGIIEMVQKARSVIGYTPKPILFNEDDHYDFDKPQNNLIAAVSQHVSWGFFDFRRKNEGFDDGFQSVPVNWSISSPRKQAFFDLLGQVTGTEPTIDSNAQPNGTGAPDAVNLDSSWRLWLDTSAKWESDTLYLPDETGDLSKLPQNQPSGGWDTLNKDTGIATTLPDTPSLGGVYEWSSFIVQYI